MHCVAGDDVTAGPLRDNRAGSMTVWWKSRSFSNPPTVYEDRPTSIHHWQLRDLISSGDNAHSFYCVCDEQVILYDCSTHSSCVVMDLEFSPNCMTYRHGFLAAGGICSELEVLDTTCNRLCFSGKIGHTVNNALHINKLAGRLQLYVCTNDDAVKVYSLPSMDLTTTIRCHVPINYAALSPNKMQLACVGDCNEALLYTVRPDGYVLDCTLAAACDVGMVSAWSHTGGLMATAHQDGTAAVWDPRSSRLVARYDTGPGAARNVKFAAAPVDLLAVAEHTGVVHLLDARRWDSVHQLVLPLPHAARTGQAADISGIAFTAHGERLWVGATTACLQYDIRTLERRTFTVGSVV